MRIIAEVGPNHNGDLGTALEMVRVASFCGVTTCKFQHIDPQHFRPDMVWQGCNLRELFEKVRFTLDQWREVKAECEKQGVGFLCSPQTVGDFEDLLELGIEEVKISSDNLGNFELWKAVVQLNIPAIMSSGMASGKEIMGTLKQYGGSISPRKLTFLVCTSEYPCPPEGANLKRLNEMETNQPWFRLGLSDHTVGNTAAIMAVALGATVFEKHFTLDHSMEGPDHSWSADPGELAFYVQAICQAEKMLGSGEFKPTEKELEAKKFRRL